MSIQSRNRAFRRDLLTQDFEKAGLGFKVLGGPLGPNPEIFQMDINITKRSGEYFRIWPGARDNQIEVLFADRRFKQLVLRVKEPRRPYTEKRVAETEHQFETFLRETRESKGRVVSLKKGIFLLERFTPSVERRYLCGLDDLHYFVAQVREGDTVREAHASLKPQQVKDAEGQVRRQGEWFFLPLFEEKRWQISEWIKTESSTVAKDKPIGQWPTPRPHIAEELVRRTSGQRRGRRVFFGREMIYARGTIRHAEHRPLRLDDWHRVVINREANREDQRLRWID